jgi:hypothetical protein
MSPQLLRRKKAALGIRPRAIGYLCLMRFVVTFMILQLVTIMSLLVSKKDRYTSMKLLGPDNQWKANELEHYPSLNAYFTTLIHKK